VTDEMIRKGLVAVQAYKDFLVGAYSEFVSLKPPDWYPKKFLKAYESWTMYFDGRTKFIDMVLQALEPPQPLERQPGQDKRNMFVGGWNMIEAFTPGGPIPTN